MPVPTRSEALSLLLSLSPAPRLLQHVTVVAEVAAFLAYRAAGAGIGADRRLIETAALLHDVDKALPRDDPLRQLGHGAAGAAWLREAGHPELAPALLAHPVSRLAAPDAASWLASAPIEERIVTYADKRAIQRVVTLEQRFERWRRRHPEYGDGLARALAMAHRLEAGLCDELAIAPTDVQRLRWVGHAMAHAEANGQLPDALADPSAA